MARDLIAVAGRAHGRCRSLISLFVWQLRRRRRRKSSPGLRLDKRDVGTVDRAVHRHIFAAIADGDRLTGLRLGIGDVRHYLWRNFDALDAVIAKHGKKPGTRLIAG